MPSFVCDAMLGSLARWLRLFGYDCLYLGAAADRQLAELARSSGRWLLTRDAELAASGPRTMHVRADHLEGQLREVFTRLRLSPSPDLDSARCAECNGELVDVDRSEIAGVVPPYVLETANRFRRCPSCGRVYWPGSHTPRILARMRGVVDGGS